VPSSNQAVLVARKVRGDPIEDDADAALVQGIDQEHEILWRAEATRGGEIADG